MDAQKKYTEPPLRVTKSSAAVISKGNTFGLEGDLFIIPVIGGVTGVFLSIIAWFFHAGWILSTIICLFPFVGSILFIFNFFVNKPPHYLEDWWDTYIEHNLLDQDVTKIQ